jgi:hypothetical protein
VLTDDPKDIPKDYESLCHKFQEYCSAAAVSYRGDSLLVLADALEELDSTLTNAAATKSATGARACALTWE